MTYQIKYAMTMGLKYIPSYGNYHYRSLTFKRKECLKIGQRPQEYIDADLKGYIFLYKIRPDINVVNHVDA